MCLLYLLTHIMPHIFDEQQQQRRRYSLSFQIQKFNNKKKTAPKTIQVVFGEYNLCFEQTKQEKFT